MLKKILIFCISLLVSTVGTFSIVFIATGMSFGFPKVQEIETKDGTGIIALEQNERLNVLLFSRSDTMPILNDRESVIRFDPHECVEVGNESFQTQTQSANGDYLSGVALFSIFWTCANSGEVEFSVDEDFLVRNDYLIGVQGGYGGFFFNVFVVISVSILLTFILYKVALLLLAKVGC